MTRKFYVLLLAMTMSSLFAIAQCERPIILNTQADVDAFPSRYGCSVLQDNLTIIGYPTGDITNLDSLYIIERVEGYVTIQANVWLTDMTGLSNLRHVSGYFNVSDNSRLFSLEGLHNLESCYGISVTGSEVYDLTGLRGLKNVGDRVTLTDLRRITSLDGLQNIESMYGLEVSGNPHLNDVSAVGGNITWILSVSNNPELTSLAGLEDVEFNPTGVIAIQRNPVLASLDGLPAIDTINEIMIIDNPQLADVSVLGSISNIGQLWIEKNYALTSLGDFPNLSEINTLKIIENSSLNTLEGFSTLTKASFLQIMGSPPLTNLNGFRNITKVDSALWIGHNPGLVDLTGLDNLDSVGYVFVYSNNNLTSLHGLESLRYLEGNRELPGIHYGLTLYQDRKLADISALSQVTTINGNLDMELLDALENLNGLEHVTSITGSLRITGNAMLENLDDLEALENVGPGPGGNAVVEITDNSSLGSFCGLYTLVSGASSSLPFTIENNEVDKTPEQIVADGPCDGEPNPEPGELVFTNITDTTMTVSFTPIEPAPTGGYLLLLRANNSPYPEDVPLDGNTYNVGNVIGWATIVVGKSTSNTNHEFHIVYLKPETTYHYALFTFDSGLNYDTTNPILDSQATSTGSPDPDPEPAQPTAIAFSNVTHNSMSVSFTASSGAGVDGYLTVMRAYSSSYPEDVPVDGTSYNVGNVIGSSSIVVGRGTSTTLNIIYLNPDTEYWFDVYSYTNDGSYNYVTTSPLEGMQRTSVEMMAAAYPNPFAESVTIRFNVKQQSAHVRVAIFDSMGAQVAELYNGEASQGMHEVSWNGTDSRGGKSRGMYHYTIIGHDEPVRGTVVAK